MKAKVQDELKQHFRPEFLNRVDDIVVFHQLTPGRDHQDRRPDDRQARRAAAGQGHGHRAHAGGQGAAGQARATTRCSVPGRCAARSSARSRTSSPRRSSSASCAPARSWWSTSRARATRPTFTFAGEQKAAAARRPAGRDGDDAGVARAGHPAGRPADVPTTKGPPGHRPGGPFRRALRTGCPPRASHKHQRSTRPAHPPRAGRGAGGGGGASTGEVGVHIRFLLMDAFSVGGTIRVTFTAASALADRHEVEVVSVYRRRPGPRLPLDPRVRLRVLSDERVPQLPTSDPDGRLERGLGRLPSVLVPWSERRHRSFSARTDLRLARYLRGLDGGALVATRPGLAVATARWAPPDVVRVAQEHVFLANHPRALRRAIRRTYGRLDAVVTLTERDAVDYRALLGSTARARHPGRLHPLRGAVDERPVDARPQGRRRCRAAGPREGLRPAGAGLRGGAPRGTRTGRCGSTAPAVSGRCSRGWCTGTAWSAACSSWATPGTSTRSWPRPRSSC